MSDSILAFEKVTMSFPAGDAPPRTVLRDVSFSLSTARSIALVGRSGSGKSTLLHLAAGISVPTAGRIQLYGTDLTTCSEKQRTHLRGRRVGLVFQFFHLLPHLSVGENIALPGWVAGSGRAELGPRADDLLARVGLADRRHDPVAKLSGGEMQRVAICRALLRSPGLVLADEPTGSLDDTSGREVMALLHGLVREENSTLLFVTHSRELAATADEVWQLHDGVLDRGAAS
jgi:ABC-type lipoprotein export system ATPase subunit